MFAHSSYARTRLYGSLGIALTALLSPSGKIISSAVAATVLAGGLVTQIPRHTPPATKAFTPTPYVPTHLDHSGSSAPVLAYLEVDGQILPVVLTEGASDFGSANLRLASASGFFGKSGGSSTLPGMGSPHFGQRHGKPALSSHRPDSSTPSKLQPHKKHVDNTPPSIGGIPPAPSGVPLDVPCTKMAPNAMHTDPTHLACLSDPADQGNPGEAETPATTAQGEPLNAPDVSGTGEGSPTAGTTPLPLADLNDSASPHNPDEAGAPTKPTPPQEVQAESVPGNVPGHSDPSELLLLPGQGNPFAPPILISGGAEPLPSQNGDQPPLKIASLVEPDSIPEPATIALMLLGLLGLAWTGRRSAAPARHA